MNKALVEIKKIVKSYKELPDISVVRNSMYNEISEIVKKYNLKTLVLNFEVKDESFTGDLIIQNDLSKVSRLDLINV